MYGKLVSITNLPQKKQMKKQQKNYVGGKKFQYCLLSSFNENCTIFFIIIFIFSVMCKYEKGRQLQMCLCDRHERNGTKMKMKFEMKKKYSVFDFSSTLYELCSLCSVFHRHSNSQDVFFRISSKRIFCITRKDCLVNELKVTEFFLTN